MNPIVNRKWVKIAKDQRLNNPPPPFQMLDRARDVSEKKFDMASKCHQLLQVNWCFILGRYLPKREGKESECLSNYKSSVN